MVFDPGNQWQNLGQVIAPFVEAAYYGMDGVGDAGWRLTITGCGAIVRLI